MTMMKAYLLTILVLITTSAGAQTLEQRYPACDLTAQHELKSRLGGSITDPRQAHISSRSNILEADLGTARKARRLTQNETDQLYRRVEAVRSGANHYTRKQGFLSAAEVASYDRELDAIAMQACHPAQK